MREIRSYGSVRGVRSNPYPYRDTLQPLRSSVFQKLSEDFMFRLAPEEIERLTSHKL
jgi:hypothetical protein